MVRTEAQAHTAALQHTPSSRNKGHRVLFNTNKEIRGQKTRKKMEPQSSFIFLRLQEMAFSLLLLNMILTTASQDEEVPSSPFTEFHGASSEVALCHITFVHLL